MPKRKRFTVTSRKGLRIPPAMGGIQLNFCKDFMLRQLQCAAISNDSISKAWGTSRARLKATLRSID